MPKVRLPLVGVENPRGIDGKTVIDVGQDQEFLNVIFDFVANPITKKATVYVERRPGWKQQAVIAAGSVSTGFLRAESMATTISAFGTVNSTIYDSTVSVGAITGRALYFSETILSSDTYVMIRSSDGTGWYYATGARDKTSYTGNTHTNTTIDGIASTEGMYSGQAVSGAGIQAGTRILTVDTGVAITVDTATTATATITITKTPIAKILDADFITTGENLSGFVEMDGYIFYCSEDGYVYHSDQNSFISWTSTNKIAANMSPDLPVAIGRHKNAIISHGRSSTEFFYNAGNASGSVLSRSEQNFKHIGVQNQRSVVQLEDDIYFVSSSKEGDIRVERLRDFGMQRVSTPQVDRILGTASATGSELYLSSFNMGGYSYVSVICTEPTSTGFSKLEDDYYVLHEDGYKRILEAFSAGFTVTLIYNVDLNIWIPWDGTLLTFVRGSGQGAVNQIMATSIVNTGGKIYNINPASDGAVYQDDGSTYSTIIRTSEIDHGTDDWKFPSKISLIADTEAGGTVLLEANDNGFASGSWFTVGTFDLTETRKDIHGGRAYVGGRSYRLTHAYNGPLRASALDIEYELEK